MFRPTHRRYAVAIAKRNKEDPIDIEKLEFKVNNSGVFCWVADPFPVEYKGELYIFAELRRYANPHGTIGYARMVNGKLSKWEEIINEPYHLSFPYVFEYNGDYYMCPESGECKELYLYKCENFPEKWVKDRVIIKNKELADTIFINDSTGRYGVACNWAGGVKNHYDIIFKLTDDYCLDSISEFRPKIEPFWISRPAGKIFDSKKLGQQIMVSQICQNGYGEGLAFSSFSVDWPHYSCNLIKKVYPREIKINKNNNFIGMHTFNTTDNYVVIDVVYNGFSPIELAIRGYKKILRILGVKG